MIVDFDLLFPMVLSATKFDVRTLNGEFITSTDLAVEDRDRIFSHSVGFFPFGKNFPNGKYFPFSTIFPFLT